MIRYPHSVIDPSCDDASGCIYLQRYKSIFHFADDNSNTVKNAQELTSKKSIDFKTFDWKILEVTGSYLIVYQNYGKQEHETFKEDQPSILKGQEDELIITPVQFTEMKRECGEAPEKRFCTINEYQNLGKLLTDVPDDVAKDPNISSPNDQCLVLISTPGNDKQNYFICSDDKLELEKLNFAMSMAAQNTPVKAQKNILQYYVDKSFINVMIEVDEEEVKIFKCDVKNDASKCLEDNDQTQFYELYHCKNQLFEPASGFKTDDEFLDLEHQKKENCFIMNVESAKNEKEKIQKLFCISEHTLNKDKIPVSNDFERSKIISDYIVNIQKCADIERLSHVDLENLEPQIKKLKEQMCIFSQKCDKDPKQDGCDKIRPVIE